MNSTILQYVCVPCAAVLAVIWIFAALNEKGINPLDEIFQRFRKQPLLGMLLLPILIAKLIAFASVKMPTNDVPGSGSAPTNAPMMMARGGGGNREATRPNEYWLWRVGTNEVWNFGLMPGAHVVESWRLRGAAEDWTVCATTNLGPVAMTTDGRLVTTNGVFSACDGQLAIVPEVNWTLLGTNAPSRVWWAETPWESTVFTWQNAFLGRDTNTPVSVQAEFTREGDFIYRYDLAATGTNLTSKLYYRLRPEDLADDDRDGDRLSTHDEVTVYHTDPGLVDSDGDGLLDWDEVANGTDPTTRSVPNEEIVARIVGSPTNELYKSAKRPNPDVALAAMKLWDGFAADWPDGMTNLVYERTLSLGTLDGSQRYFLSSEPDAAGDWDLRGLVLEWDDGCGNRGTALASPYGDSLPLPLTNSTVTIRLRAIGPKVRSPKPMYLVGYAPMVTASGGTPVYDAEGDLRGYFFAAGREGVRTLSVTIDRSHRPCKAAPDESEMEFTAFADLAERSDGALSYDGGAYGGTITVARPVCFQLPAVKIDDPVSPSPRQPLKAARGGAPDDKTRLWILCLDPSIDFSGEHRFVTTGLRYDEANGDYCVERYYPLDSKCLWRSWQRTEDGSWKCECEPELKARGGADDLAFVEKICEVNDERTVATGIIKVFGQEVWRDTATHSWRDVGEGGGVSCGSELLSRDDECDDCKGGCADGNCDDLSGGGLGSVEFRLSLGEPRQGQHSGFLFFKSEQPVRITPSLFALKAREDAAIEIVSSGETTTYRCSDNRGKDVALTAIEDGVRLTVHAHATGALDETWEVFNDCGASNVIRIVQWTRLSNVLRNETYVCDDGVWSKTDNVTGVTEVLERVDRTNDPADGRIWEARTTYDADGNQLDSVSTETSRIGAFGNAVLRETYWERDTGGRVKWRAAAYWNDAEHRDRHGQLRLLTGNCCAWEYHDYDTRGFEILRVVQRNGSAVPTAFPEAVAGDLYWADGLADAFVTVYDYTPFAGDSRHRDEADLPRCETRYVVRNGRAICIARTWTRYAHVEYDGYDCVKAETWRAASATSRREDEDNAYSYVITYGETEGGVPLVLRGEVAEELDENGVQTRRYVWEGWDLITEETHKWFGSVEFPTYEVVERDSDFGNELRRATCLSDSDDVVDEEVSTYDEKNRLRSTTYADGTSLTNAFSCCRKLWSRDRQGRKTLRSAETGQDRLYYADEEVWLREVSTNGGYCVTQHFFDGLGREIETVTRIGNSPGAYAVPSASSPTGEDFVSSATTAYPDGGDDFSVRVDARGKMTTSERIDFDDRTESVESVFAHEGNPAADLQTLTTAWRNGARVMERRWDGKWTRETEISDYDVDGCEVRYEVAESSDCGVVTNRIETCDFLGRTIREVTPDGMTVTTYHGATDRADTATLTAGEVVQVTTTLYDARGEAVGSSRDGVARRTDEAYETDADGNWWKVSRSTVATAEETESATERREQLTGRGSGVVSRRVDIDADGVVEETVERLGAAEGERVTVVSDAVQGVTTQTRRYGVVTEMERPDQTERYDYDSLARQVVRSRVTTAGNGACERSSYDGVGNLIARTVLTNAVVGVTELYGYDSYGRRVSATDAIGNETVTRYDAVGNVVEQSGATWPVRYEYDTAGRRVSLSTTKDGRIWDVTRWSYDPQTGKCIAKRYPDGSQVSYALTSDGLPQTTTKASGAWVRNAYDAKRLLVGTVSSDGAGDAGFEYDAFGKMTAASNGVARYAYARHRGGVVTNEWVDLGRIFQIVRTVDGFGRLAGRGVSDQDSQTIVYDGQGRVTAVSSGVAVATYAYGAGGVDAGYTLALNGGATIERRVVRDAYRPEQIVSVSNFVNGVAVGGETYTRDAKGRIVEREDGRQETRDTFGYDAVGQVVEVANCQLPSTNYQLTSYSYDLIGNIAGSEALAYTADGEVTGLGGWSFGYDSASRLTTVTTGDVTIATYAYDAFDRRVRKTTPEATTTYLYDGWNLVREEIAGTNGTTDVVEYYWGKDISGSLDTAGGIGGLLYLKRNGSVYVPLYDASGNVTAYVDASGNVVVTFTYDAFGNSTVHLHLSPSPYIPAFRYSTKYYDAETGLIYYGYRYYAPTTARWLTRDPLEEQGGLNLHCFCENDGVNKVDWLGKVPEPTADGDGRRFWRLIAKRLRDEKQYNRAADMLEWSLNAHQHWFASSSDMSKDIKGSLEYDLVVKALIGSYAPGWKGTVNQNKKVLDYNGGDLLSAVNKTLVDGADISFTGNGCKSKDGLTYDFKLKVKVDSVYKYGDWRYDDLTLTEEDLGNMERHNSLVKEFSWSAEFMDRRK